MDFVLQLHTHLPYVLNHGRWPHGSDWICEAALDTYLPLLDELLVLKADAVPSPLTIGFTPVLANQLASPTFVEEMNAFFTQRLEACDEAPASLAETGDTHLLPLVDFWRERLTALRELFWLIDGDLVAAFRRLEQAGRVELIGSAATHGFLPLLGRDESIRLQLGLGRAEHKRLFGRLPDGCWLPECAYRGRGPWEPLPGGPRSPMRRGIDEHLGDAGFRFFYVDSHQARAGDPLGLYAEVPLAPSELVRQSLARLAPAERSPYHAYRVSRTLSPAVAALVRDPRSTLQVWSRHRGYPGDSNYLEFHKTRWPGGLKLWRVTGHDIDLGRKEPYDPVRARDAVATHARHFVDVLAEVAATRPAREQSVIVAPFDTELFGHWWFEGVAFLGQMYRELQRRPVVRATPASAYVGDAAALPALRLAAGSWGANGDFSMWLNPETTWTWQELWRLEDRFWDVAPAALERPAAEPVLAQAARSLLLAQSSDWQFIISTGDVADYAIQRFRGHVDDLRALLQALEDGSEGALTRGQYLAATLAQRDALFPDVLPHVAAAAGGSRAMPL
ncbi:MAG: 1,4-alpha-glucan branching protein domain-containing protein [Gemmatimonadota bacterium]